ncbi:MAG TPA: NrdJb [Pseudomonadales bacterium]
MTINIESRIVAFEVLTEPERMHERVSRPEVLEGRTYKVKTPLSEHALYVTINDMVLNAGTPHESRHPFEIFINSKNMDHFQWIVALTRIVSAVFRKGGDCTFLVEELQSVFDPRGGYFKPGGRFMPSLVAEIGAIIERHLEGLGMLERDVDPHRDAYLAQKRAEAAAREARADAGEGFPADAALCAKCLVRAAVLLDGCLTCLNCGESKCS